MSNNNLNYLASKTWKDRSSKSKKRGFPLCKIKKFYCSNMVYFLIILEMVHIISGFFLKWSVLRLKEQRLIHFSKLYNVKTWNFFLTLDDKVSKHCIMLCFATLCFLLLAIINLLMQRIKIDILGNFVLVLACNCSSSMCSKWIIF